MTRKRVTDKISIYIPQNRIEQPDSYSISSRAICFLPSRRIRGAGRAKIVA